MPLSADYDTEEGSNPHFAIVDEYHVHPTSGMLDMLESGMVAREQALLFIITTAGFNTASPCFDYRKSVVSMLQGKKENNSTFGIIFGLDEKDDWRDEKVWIKATPNLGNGIPLQNFKEELEKATATSYTDELKFRVKNLNQWINDAKGWIAGEKWKESGRIFTLENLKGRSCYAGLDLASTRDITALTLLFPPEDDEDDFYAFWRLYCPEDMITTPKKNDGQINYQQWWQDGFITMTDGNITDYRYIEKDIEELNLHFEIKRLGYDRYKSYEIITRLQESGILVEPVPQTFLGMSAPMQQVERLIYSKKLSHNNNPVVQWMLGNVAVMMDGNDNIKLDRKNKKDKIDGIASLIDAMNVYMNFYDDDGQKSVYEERGIRLL